MKLVNLGETNSLLNSYIAQVRDKVVQKDSQRFRSNLRRIGQVFAYEISKTLDYSAKDVQTPLGTAQVNTFDTKIVLATILRAGLPLHEGMLSYFEGAESAFLAAYRKYDAADKFHINAEYCSTPNLNGIASLIPAAPNAALRSAIRSYCR